MVIIVFGRLPSTRPALNATVLVSSRVAFSMGRGNRRPGSMARIHPPAAMPQIAIVVTGVILLAIAVLPPLEAVNFGFVVPGAAKEPFFRRMPVGGIREKVARNSPASALIVKGYEGPVKSFLKRVLG